MEDNQSKNIIPKKSDGRLSKASDLAKRGLHLAQNPTSVQYSELSQFLDSVGGIPDNNLDVRFQEINKTLINYFSKMTVDEISRELEIELIKRTNGRTLKLLGFSYFHGGNIDNAIRVLTDCLKITSEDPVAIYELLGRCYVLKRDRENARRWFADSYRYDYEFFLEVFGWDFLYVTAVGRYRTRPPIFGEAADTFGKRALEIEIMADALSMCYGNKKGRKSLASAYVESVVSEMVEEYTKDSLKAIEDTKIIKDVVSQLLRELENSNQLIKASDQHEQIDVLLSKGKALTKNGDLQQAIIFFEDALKSSEKIDYKFGKEGALGYLGLIHTQMGNAQVAVTYLEKALATCRANNNQRDIGTNLINLGNAYQNLGELELATNCYEEAIVIDRQSGNQYEVASDLYLLGQTYGKLENFYQAIKCLGESLAIFHKLEDANGVVTSSVGLASALMQVNEFERAISLSNDAIQLGGKIKHPLTQEAKELKDLIEALQTMHIEMDQAYQAFLSANTPLNMEKAVIRFPFLVDEKFIEQLKNAEMPKSSDINTAFSTSFMYSKKILWLEQIAQEEQFVDSLINFNGDHFETDNFQTRCLRTYIPTMVISPKHELGFQAFLCTRSITELKKIARNFPYMLSDNSFITGVEHVIQSLPKYEHPRALQERLDALIKMKK